MQWLLGLLRCLPITADVRRLARSLESFPPHSFVICCVSWLTRAIAPAARPKPLVGRRSFALPPRHFRSPSTPSRTLVARPSGCFSLRPRLRCATSLLALAVTVAPAKPDDGVRSSEERTARPFVRGESCAWFRTKTVAACPPPFPRTRASPKKSYCYFCCCCRRQLADQESASTSLVGRRFQRAIGSRAKRLENVPETLCFPYYSLPALQVTMQRRSQ